MLYFMMIYSGCNEFEYYKLPKKQQLFIFIKFGLQLNRSNTGIWTRESCDPEGQLYRPKHRDGHESPSMCVYCLHTAMIGTR